MKFSKEECAKHSISLLQTMARVRATAAAGSAEGTLPTDTDTHEWFKQMVEQPEAAYRNFSSFFFLLVFACFCFFFSFFFLVFLLFVLLNVRFWFTICIKTKE